MTYTSEEDETRVISDTGDRGYGVPAEDIIHSKNDKKAQYFKYYEYIEKKPKNNDKEKND